MDRLRGMMWYLLGGVVILGFWQGINALPEEIISVLLKPYVWAAEIFYDMRFTYIEEVGYIESSQLFSIVRGCLGHSFMSMLFTTTYFGFIGQVKHKLKWLGACMCLGIVGGYIVNSIRILASIPFLESTKFEVIHKAIGMGLYLLILISAYYVLEKIIKIRGRKNETIYTY